MILTTRGRVNSEGLFEIIIVCFSPTLFSAPIIDLVLPLSGEVERAGEPDEVFADFCAGVPSLVRVGFDRSASASSFSDRAGSKYFASFFLDGEAVFACATDGRLSLDELVFAATVSPELPVETDLKIESPPNKNKAIRPRTPPPIIIER